MSQAAITVENLSKAYRIGLKEEIPDTLFGAASSFVRSPFKNFQRLRSLNTYDSHHGEAEDIVWALKDVSFEVQEGEVLGVIGRNGAGKSTLLKILSRITKPTSGRAIIRGRVSSLLEVGTGFHPELSGRENVYMNGTILGMTKREIDRKFDEIVDFSGVERFLDTPIKRYSSGMKVRLAFAVAAHLEPEILIIDEVLAVGDAEFQRKCLGKMQNVAEGGRTVLFVSHNMPSVLALCTRAVLVNAGCLQYDGIPSNAIDQHVSSSVDILSAPPLPFRSEFADVDSFTVKSYEGRQTGTLPFLAPFTVNIDITLKSPLPGVHMLLALYRKDDDCRVASITTRESACSPLTAGHNRVICEVDHNPLLPGVYAWTLQLRRPGDVFLTASDIATTAITERTLEGASHPYVRNHGCVHICSDLVVHHTNDKHEPTVCKS